MPSDLGVPFFDGFMYFFVLNEIKWKGRVEATGILDAHSSM